MESFESSLEVTMAYWPSLGAVKVNRTPLYPLFFEIILANWFSVKV